MASILYSSMVCLSCIFRICLFSSILAIFLNFILAYLDSRYRSSSSSFLR